MYSIKVSNGKTLKRAKGVKKRVLKKEIIHKNYREVLSKGKTHHPMNMTRHEFHRLYTTRVNKISLSALDTKIYILKDGIHTLDYEHYKILLEHYKFLGGNSVSFGTICNSSLPKELVGPPSR